MNLRAELEQELRGGEAPRPWTPLPYMKKCVEFLLKHCGSGLLLDPGMRKTSITLKAISILLKQRLMRRALVIAPLRPCYMVWPAEMYKWTDFHGLRYSILHGSHKEEALEQDADIYIINPDGLPWLTAGGGMDNRLRQLSPDMLVVDESSKFRNTQSQRFKLLRPFLDTFKRRHILTGSPTPKSYLDLFGQIYILDQGNALGQYITHYRTNYFYPSGYMGYDWKLQDGAEKRIHRQIKPLVVRFEAGDYLKLPKPTPNVIRVQLPDKARKTYKDLEEEMITTIESREIVAVNAAVASGKCAQVANGGLYHSDAEVRRAMGGKREWALVHTAKDEALAELVEELQGTPLLIGYEYDHDRERILQVLGKDTLDIGKVGMTQAKRIENKWNSGELPYIIGQVAAVAHGLNLQYGGCRNVCFYSVPWDFEIYDQFIKRICRSGNTAAHVRVHHLIARDTVDELKMVRLRKKERGQTGLLQALRSYVRGLKSGETQGKLFE